MCLLGPAFSLLSPFCFSGGTPSTRITPEFSKWASDGESRACLVPNKQMFYVSWRGGGGELLFPNLIFFCEKLTGYVDRGEQ